MAWSIGIAFVCSVGFLLVLGWGADLLFGSSPWGVVIGIIIGSLIGFYQLFRFSSQIFKQ
jgi:F0F1-type ATP synthase assembly protein I